MFHLLCFTLLPAWVSATYVITIYGDVMRDTTFFTETYPWIIDNIGGHISVDYFLLGSGRYSVPQMCALAQLKGNTFVQAQYLKCEAQGAPSEVCLCSNGIDHHIFRQCVLEKGNKAALASLKYSQLNLDESPVVEMWPKNTVFGVPDTSYLKKICTIFSEDEIPRGCIKPFGCHNTTVFADRKAVVNFDCHEVAKCDTKTTVTTPATPNYYEKTAPPTPTYYYKTTERTPATPDYYKTTERTPATTDYY